MTAIGTADSISTTIPERRLAAILCADVVGYSRMMASNEESGLLLIKQVREHVKDCAGEFSGRLVDFVGDNLLAEFPSVVNALRCATRLQRERPGPEEGRPQIRIGIHVGDILAEGGRLYGDSINVASRIEALAEPGGISLSAPAFDHIGSHSGFRFEFAGEHQLKNIDRPVGIYRLLLDGEPDPSGIQPHSLTISESPAIAVLPFDNMSNDPEQDYFTDGMVEDLITALSLFRSFPVIARNSTFAYKGRQLDLREVSRELGARYIVEGSVRRHASHVRITAQLIDAYTGHHIWGQRYDRDIGDIFALQDEISTAIGGVVMSALEAKEIERVLHKSPSCLTAWEQVQRGSWHLRRLTREDTEIAKECYRRAAEISPRMASPHSMRAVAATHAIAYDFTDDVMRELSEGMSAARRSVQLAPDEPQSRISLGWMCAFARRYDEAIQSHQLALELNPSSAAAHHGLGFSLSMAECSNAAIDHLETAIRLSPNDPWQHFVRGHLGQAYFQERDYESAIAETRASIELRHSGGFFYLLAAAWGQLGGIDEGRQVLEEMSHRTPDYTLDQLRRFLPPSLIDLHVEGLRKLDPRFA